MVCAGGHDGRGAAASAACPTRRATRRRGARRRRRRRRGAGWRRAPGPLSAARRTSVGRAPGSPCAASSTTPPRPAAFGELADLGAAQREDVVGDVAPRIGAARQRVAEPGDRRAGGVPRRRGGRARARRPARAPAPRPRDRVGEVRRRARRSRPGCRRRRPTCTGRTSAAARSSYASRTPVQPARRLQPERRGHGVLGQGTGRPSACARCRVGQLGQRADLRASSASTSVDGVARRTSISAVSTTSWLVRPRCSQRARRRRSASEPARAAAPTSADDGVAAGLGARGQPARRRAGSTERLRGRARPRRRARCPPPTSASSQASSTATIAARKRLVGEQVAGAFVAGPQQVGHRQSACPSRRGTPSRPRPGSRMSNTKPCVVGPARPAWRAGPRSSEASSAVVGQDRRPGQVGAGEEPVEQAAGEHGDGEERRVACWLDPAGTPGVSVVNE